ncbi:hypothetical protein Tco_1059016 [Tanacetum coccineum]
MLEKTFSTFHASNMLLQQQYRERGFKKYHELISVLLVAEQNNELLMKNHQARPTGSTALPEANATSNVRGRGRGNNRENERGRGRGRSRNIVWRHDGYNPNPHDFKDPNVHFDSSDFFDDVEDVVASFLNDENVN